MPEYAGWSQIEKGMGRWTRDRERARVGVGMDRVMDG
jgi:hypothetical protein